jgi:hypothetical protein
MLDAVKGPTKVWRAGVPAAVVAAAVILLSLRTAGCDSRKANKGDADGSAAMDDGGTGAGGVDSGGSADGDGGSTVVTGSVLQHHNNASRDGLYIEPLLTRAAAATLQLDPSFAGATIMGPTFAQPLYVAGADGERDLVIAATEQNQVTAFDAASGAQVWGRTLGTPVPRGSLPCGNFTPVGVTGTPVVDAATGTLFVAAMVMGSGGGPQHIIHSLDVATGEPRAGWPVDVGATASAGDTTFNTPTQNQRGALLVLGGNVYVPYGGHWGDCGDYHGWVVGVSTTDPTQVSAWATRGDAGGIWAVGGLASDGASLFFATGNTRGASTWADGEAVIRLPPTLVASGQTSDYFAPTNWQELDEADADLGGTAPVLVDVPGAKPSKLILALGKDGRAYLLDRDRLGGVAAPLAGAAVASGVITASVAYMTPSGTFVAFKGRGIGCPSGQSGAFTAIKIAPTAPPTISIAWCAGSDTQAALAASVTDTQGSNPILWYPSTYDNRLRAMDGETGEEIFTSGSDVIPSVQKFQSVIVAKGRIFVAGSQVFAFTTR